MIPVFRLGATYKRNINFIKKGDGVPLYNRSARANDSYHADCHSGRGDMIRESARRKAGFFAYTVARKIFNL